MKHIGTLAVGGLAITALISPAAIWLLSAANTIALLNAQHSVMH